MEHTDCCDLVTARPEPRTTWRGGRHPEARTASAAHFARSKESQGVFSRTPPVVVRTLARQVSLRLPSEIQTERPFPSAPNRKKKPFRQGSFLPLDRPGLKGVWPMLVIEMTIKRSRVHLSCYPRPTAWRPALRKRCMESDKRSFPIT